MVSIVKLHRILCRWDECRLPTRSVERLSEEYSDIILQNQTILAFGKLFRTSFVILCLSVAVHPTLRAHKVQAQVGQEHQVDWPTEFRGQSLLRLPLSKKEEKFSNNFPGEIARFTDGQNEVLIRWVKTASRQLHPASDCLRGAGFSVSPLPVMADSQSGHWNCVLATKGVEKFRVCEQIRALNNEVYTDVSTWYWSAIINSEQGPWFAYTLAERISG